jgi:hypothetical protein
MGESEAPRRPQVGASETLIAVNAGPQRLCEAPASREGTT